MAHQGYQLTTFLYGLWCGRRKMPPAPRGERSSAAHGNNADSFTSSKDLSPAEKPPEKWVLGQHPGPVVLSAEGLGECPAVQMDSTTCGSAALTMIALTDAHADTCETLRELAQNDPQRAAQTAPQGASGTIENLYAAAQQAVKSRTSHRAMMGLLHWPGRWGTPPWGAARVAHFLGHDYQDRMVVATSLPQYQRVMGHSVECVRRGFPVMLYAGSDTRRGVTASVPRHVVVLHQPPSLCGTEHLLIFDPATANNTQVSVSDVMNRQIPANALGGWQHIMWAVFPRPSSDRSSLHSSHRRLHHDTP